MMREVRTLQGRLQECTLQRLAPQQGLDAHTVEQGIELLGISDNRISCLIAETQLLFASDGASGGGGGAGEGEELQVGSPTQHATDLKVISAEATCLDRRDAKRNATQAAVRQAFAELLVESAQLRKTHNSLLRNALVQGASHGSGVEALGSSWDDAAAHTQSLLRRFL
jgi:hypothetical protein